MVDISFPVTIFPHLIVICLGKQWKLNILVHLGLHIPISFYYKKSLSTNKYYISFFWLDVCEQLLFHVVVCKLPYMSLHLMLNIICFSFWENFTVVISQIESKVLSFPESHSPFLYFSKENHSPYKKIKIPLKKYFPSKFTNQSIKAFLYRVTLFLLLMWIGL